MTKEEAIDILQEDIAINKHLIDTLPSAAAETFKNDILAYNMAIKSLEAWEKIEKEIDDSILICRKDAQNNNWCDGELAGFLQCKDIIDRNLSEVEHGSHNM
jgi:hypothetical protein